MGTQFGILAMIQQGYYATYPLLLISVACLAIIFERLWALRGIGSRAAKSADSLIPPLRQGKFNEALQATQARSNASERVYHTLISAAQSQDRDHLDDLDYERHPDMDAEDGHPRTGMAELEISPAEIDQLYQAGTLESAAVRDLPCHTGLVLYSGAIGTGDCQVSTQRAFSPAHTTRSGSIAG